MALTHLFRVSFVRARAAQPLGVGGHDVAEAQPALIFVIGAPDVLAVHVVQKTVDGLLRVGEVANEAR